MNPARGMYAAVCSGDIDMFIFQEPAKETNLCFRLRTELCPLSLHRSASPTTAIRVSAAQIKCKQSDLTSWRLTAEASLLRKPVFCQRQTTSRLRGKKAYLGDTQQACFQMKEMELNYKWIILLFQLELQTSAIICWGCDRSGRATDSSTVVVHQLLSSYFSGVSVAAEAGLNAVI